MLDLRVSGDKLKEFLVVLEKEIDVDGVSGEKLKVLS